MKLNLGCGDRYAEGWHNVDFGTTHRVDERVDLTGALPWEPGAFTHAYAGHVLEHIAPEDCVPMLRRLRRCMTPGGHLLVVGPDCDVAQWMIDNGTFDFTYHSMELLEHGAGRWAGDEHLWRCTAAGVYELISEAGWREISDLHGVAHVDDFWPVADRSPQWQLAVGAVA